jgi:hypothetical protein
VCRLEDCDRIARRDFLCETHFKRRAAALTDWDAAIPHRHNRLGAFERFGKTLDYTILSYGAVHQRMRLALGSARAHRCRNECGKQASTWAYDGTDPDELFGPNQNGSWSFYSLRQNFYQPMCHRCHLLMDKRRAAQELLEYRLWKQQTGMTLKDLNAEMDNCG